MNIGSKLNWILAGLALLCVGLMAPAFSCYGMPVMFSPDEHTDGAFWDHDNEKVGFKGVWNHCLIPVFVWRVERVTP